MSRRKDMKVVSALMVPFLILSPIWESNRRVNSFTCDPFTLSSFPPVPCRNYVHSKHMIGMPGMGFRAYLNPFLASIVVLATAIKNAVSGASERGRKDLKVVLYLFCTNGAFFILSLSGSLIVE